MAACPDGRCDGSGFLFDEAAPARRPCSCRPAGSRASAPPRSRAGSRSAIARSRFEREPLISIERANPHVVREVRQYIRTIAEQLDAGRGLWFTGDVGHRQDDARDADLQGRDGGRPHRRDLLAPAAARAAARHLPGRRAVLAERADRPADRRRPAARRRRRRRADARPGCSSSSTRSSTPATRTARAILLTTNLVTPTATTRCASRSATAPCRGCYEICGDPKPMFGEDQRLEASAIAPAPALDWDAEPAYGEHAAAPCGSPRRLGQRHGRHRHHRRPVGRRGQGQDHRPARRERRPGDPLPGRQQRRPHDRPRRRRSGSST